MKTDRFETVATISNKDNDTEKDNSKKLDWNKTVSTVGSTLVGIFKKPDNITNTTVIQPKEDDNTMLYVGLGGAALLVVLLFVFMK